MPKKITNCDRCGHLKKWEGDDILCPFQKREEFDDNWNCGIIGKIRKLCEIAMDGSDSRLHYQRCEDSHYVTVKVNPDDSDALCLWVSWYKNRGCTESMFMLHHEAPPSLPTFEDLINILNFYGIQTNKRTN